MNRRKIFSMIAAAWAAVFASKAVAGQTGGVVIRETEPDPLAEPPRRRRKEYPSGLILEVERTAENAFAFHANRLIPSVKIGRRIGGERGVLHVGSWSEIEGVESSLIGRYKIEIVIGPLFDIEEIIQRVGGVILKEMDLEAFYVANPEAHARAQEPGRPSIQIRSCHNENRTAPAARASDRVDRLASLKRQHEASTSTWR
jgi:hypothetical protein